MYSINCNVYLHFFANKLKQIYFGNVYILLIYIYCYEMQEVQVVSFYNFMKNYEGEKSHFGDLFEGMKDIDFPEDISTPRDIIERFHHWLEEPSLHDTIHQAIETYQQK